MKKFKRIFYDITFIWNSNSCFYWCKMLPIHLNIVCSCFHLTVAELSSCDRLYVVLSTLQTVVGCTTNHTDKIITWHFMCHMYCDNFIFLITNAYSTRKNNRRREDWTLNVAFLGHSGLWIILLSKCKALCLLFSDIAVLKNKNIHWHYRTKYSW